MNKFNCRNKLIIGASEANPDLTYATNFFVPDDVIFLQVKNSKILVLNKLEFDRGKQNANVDEVVSLEKLIKIANSKYSIKKTSLANLAVVLLIENGIKNITLANNAPYLLVKKIQKYNIKTRISENPLLFPSREFKSKDEVKNIKKAIKKTEIGLARAEEILKASKITKKRFLKWNGNYLSSEILHGEIDSTIAKLGAVAMHTITAGGIQACDPHEIGYGKLKANELIIVDVFPKDLTTGYFGDLTRTWLRGKANENQKKLWHTCLKAQKKAINSIKVGMSGNKLQKNVQNFFVKNSYKTELIKGRNVGFFHGLGHGLGLELHEEPRLASTKIKKQQVFSIEPGLYYPKIGGVRHEDIVVIKKNGAKVLSSYPKNFEL